MISGDLAKLLGKKIKSIVAYDCFGYDRGFEIVTEDGVRLVITPHVLWHNEARLKVDTNGEKEMRRPTWYWRIWWWFGYHGLYQINWWLKRKGYLDDGSFRFGM